MEAWFPFLPWERPMGRRERTLAMAEDGSGEVVWERGGQVMIVHHQNRCCCQGYPARDYISPVSYSGLSSPGCAAAYPCSRMTWLLLLLQPCPAVSRSVGRCTATHQEKPFFGLLYVLLVLVSLLLQTLGQAAAVDSSPSSGTRSCHRVMIGTTYHCVVENVNLSSALLPCLSWRDSLQK